MWIIRFKKTVLAVSPVDLDVYIELSSEPLTELLVFRVDLTITGVTEEGKNVMRIVMSLFQMKIFIYFWMKLQQVPCYTVKGWQGWI